MVSHKSLCDSKSLQVSRTLLSIPADLNNAVVWIVSTCPLISKSSRHFCNPLVTNIFSKLLGIKLNSIFCSRWINRTWLFLLSCDSPVVRGCTPTASLQRSKTAPTTVLYMTLNLLWRGSRLGDVCNVEYPFIAITPRSALIWSGSTW